MSVEQPPRTVDPDDISAEAAAALTAAHRRAIESGLEVVYASNDRLIRRLPSGEEIVIQELPKKRIAGVLVKRRTLEIELPMKQPLESELKRANS